MQTFEVVTTPIRIQNHSLNVCLDQSYIVKKKMRLFDRYLRPDRVQIWRMRTTLTAQLDTPSHSQNRENLGARTARAQKPVEHVLLLSS